MAALWSRTRTTAERLAQQLNQSRLQVYDNWQELIEQASVDVISITTPPMLRREPVLAALEKGCHVLIEKPFSVGLTDAQAMIQAVNSANTVTATCFNWRYAPAYAGVSLIQYTWDRLVADFVQAIREGDVAHKSVP
ncbi:MAG TPA: Gfo/Idh/MocA family oxidoreductase, partial [Anaerolineae bacterium]